MGEYAVGRKTLYHPVSLNVIRGSLELCGFKPGTIRQTVANETMKWAYYTVTLIDPPNDFKDLNQFQQIKMLNGCFAADITVYWAGWNTKGQWCMNITSRLVDVQDSGDLDWPDSQRG